MALNIILPNTKLVLSAYAALVGATPGSAALAEHKAYADSLGRDGYLSALDALFVDLGYTNAQMGAAMLTNLGLTAVFTQADAEAYLAANQGNRVAAVLALSDALLTYNGTDAGILAAKTAYADDIDFSYTYSSNAANTAAAALPSEATVGINSLLTVGQDNLTGTALDDTFTAYIFDNSNTLQSGDVITGGSGFDTLFADIGNSQNFAITPHTTGIETAAFRVQADQPDSGDNNIEGKGIIDAQRMDGVTTYEDNGSRADLVIEDVRIRDNEITKDITIVMRDTDPGAVDFAVYFDQNSLRNVSSATSIMNLRVLDTYATAQGLDPLLDSPYGSFTFYFSLDSGATYTKATLASDAMQTAQTLEEMVTAMQDAADALFGAGAVTVSLGSSYSVPDSVTGNEVSGKEIVITAEDNVLFDTTGAGSGWLATETVPAISGLYTSFNQNLSSETELVTSSIVLDNVGRGSNGGDLIVGALSVGDTSNSQGVQQFDIIVEDSSKLSNINSTNNTLQVVNILNGTADEMAAAYYDPSEGNLSVGIDNNQPNDLPGDDDQDNLFGFSDVRVIDASAMTGKLAFTAEFTEAAVGKYLDLVDTANNPAGDNIDVMYDGGTNDDTMVVALDGEAVGSHSNINVGREDFTFVVNGNGGDDSITVGVDHSGTGGLQAWYNNQVINDNITVNGGAGNDTIRTPGAGNMNINGDAGDDTIYADNTGAQAAIDALDATGLPSTTTSNAVFVFNTDDQAVDNPVAQNLYDLVSDPRETVGSYGVDLTVTFRGLTSTVALADTDYRLSDLEVNQAIKLAINSDDVLSKLLVAEDGPSGTLIVTALIDGVHATGDLGVAFSTVLAADLNPTILAGYNTANGTTLANEALLAAAINGNTATMALNYVTQTADSTAGVEIVGANSSSSSDNVIEGGAGDDVIVLGTTGDELGADGDNFTAFSGNTSLFTNNADSNDTVVYAAAWGNDVIVNFTADLDVTAGEFSRGSDLLDFSALLGTTATSLGLHQVSAGAVASTDSLIQTGTFDNTGVALTGLRNDSAAEVAKLYTDDLTANNGIYVTVSAGNVGTVYAVADGTGAADLTVTLMGTIDLADTAWTSLTLDNFA